MRDSAASHESSYPDPGSDSGPYRLAVGPGTPLGPFVVHRRLQRGGCAEVFHCFHTGTGAEAAVKLVRSDAPQVARLQRALRLEGALLRRVDHPHVVRLYEQAELADGTPYLAMELARGHDLADRIDQHGRAPIPMIVEVGRQLSSALAALSAVGIVHRDVKPENIMLEETDDGLRVKLIDLGIAISTLAPWSDPARGPIGAFAGTPQYVSPEQAQALPVDQRADVYSLGAVLYELLVGVPPCVGSTTYDTLVKVITTEPPSIRLARPDCPRALESAVLQALAKRPEARFQSATSMARALEICAKLASMPEGPKAFEGAPRVPSNSTRPFELHRTSERVITPLCDPMYPADIREEEETPTMVDIARGTRIEPAGDRAALPPAPPPPMPLQRIPATVWRLEPTLAIGRSEPPRNRSAIFVESEEEARWLWPLAVAMLLIALAGAVIGSGEVDLRERREPGASSHSGVF